MVTRFVEKHFVKFFYKVTSLSVTGTCSVEALWFRGQKILGNNLILEIL